MTPKTVAYNHVASGIASFYAERAPRVGQYEPYNFFVCRPKFTIFFTQRGSGRRWLITFQICDMSIRSADIRDQIWKLSEIAPNFGLFSPSQILGGGPFKTYTHFITPASWHIA